ncbi:MAG: site-specific integrase [Pirellulales bacterium]|nr:site-specific integrase [Pirellulales bacterium]
MPTSSFSNRSLRVPKYRRHRASGQAVVTLNGKDHYLGKWKSAASRAAYQQLTSQWLANGGRDPDLEIHGITLVEVIAKYVRYAKSYYRKDGKITREATIIADALRVVNELYGRTLANEFGPLALKVVRDHMIHKGWSRKYINKQIDRIRRMFKWAAGEEIVSASIYDSLRCVPGLRRGRSEAIETCPVQPVSESVVQVTLTHLPEVVSDMVRFQRLTGCRPSEVCNVRPVDVDTKGDIWQYGPAIHKTQHYGRQRVVFIGPKAQDVLRKYLLRPAESFCFSPVDSERKRREAQHEIRKTPSSCGNFPGSNRKLKPKRPPRNRYDDPNAKSTKTWI